MQLKPQLKLSQNLFMTPQLQQAIKLLQLSRQELVEVVQEELLENPVLEDALGTQDAEQEPGGDGDARQLDANASEPDWERYLEQRAEQPGLPASRALNDELPSYESVATRAEDLSDHVAWQIQMSDLIEEEQAFALLVVGNLDELGYLRLDGVPEEEVVPTLAAEAHIDAEDAEEVLRMIQRMDPLGVASRSLRECLLVQADHLGLDALACSVLKDHLELLQKRNYSAIARALRVSVQEVQDVAQVIAELEPRPARRFVSEEPRYITPDVEVIKVGDDYIVRTNDDGLPRLRIGNFYRSAMRDARTKEYVQSKLRSAQWLIRCLDQRRKTIVRVTECIVQKQREFFDKGIGHMKPMILHDVAEAIQMHDSTISRVTSNKYVTTPQGIYELKFFFSPAIHRANDEDIAAASVKQAVKKIIASEDPRAPHTDQRIVEVLARQGIVIARRTVAKYRDMCGLLSASQRKRVHA